MFKRILPTFFAVLAGLLVLLGTFIPFSPLNTIRFFIIEWAKIVAVFAVILAFLQLLRIHLARLGRFRKGAITSLLVIASAIISFALVLWQGAGGEWTRQFVSAVIIPGQTALLALTAITLIMAGMRMLRKRRTFGSFLFLTVVILTLLGAVPYMGILEDIANWIQFVPALAGMRGLVLGVALGTIFTSLRIIFMTSHPHSDD